MMWPPEYSVKKHSRARRVTLRTSRANGLEIIVPVRFNMRRIPIVLAEHKDWIIDQLLLLQEQNQQAALPEQIHLHAVQQSWGIKYLSADINLRLMQSPLRYLTLVGKQHDDNARKLLSRWVRIQAKKHLPRFLENVSRQIKLPYAKVTIRDQRTRWGSCSAEKTISLNYKLLFLPPELVRHIIIHELCHTVHLDHSERFWQLVAKFDPDWQVHRKTIKQVEDLVPGWISY